MEIVGHMVEKYPELRFGQILYALSIYQAGRDFLMMKVEWCLIELKLNLRNLNKMNTIVVNGKRMQVEGNNISINGNKIFVDGEELNCEELKMKLLLNGKEI